MRRVLFLAFWLLVSFLSPVSIQSSTYKAPAPDVKIASFSPVFAVAHAQTAQILAQATSDSLKVKSTYTFAAEHGDGITHLARKAVAEYLTDSDQVNTFSDAQKVYLEDFLQNHIGTFWLSLGQTESFATSEIENAITAVKGVDTNSLAANLAQYVSKVNWQKYTSLDFARSTESQSQSSVDKNQDGTSATTDDNSGNTDETSAQTQNSNTNRTRTVVYIIIVIIILAIAGYLLFRGTEDDTMRGMNMPKDKPKDVNITGKAVPETKKEAPKTEIKPETKSPDASSNGSAPTPMKEGVQMHIGEQGKQDYTKSENK